MLTCGVNSKQLFELPPPIRPRICGFCIPDASPGYAFCIPDAFPGGVPPAPALPGSESHPRRVEGAPATSKLPVRVHPCPSVVSNSPAPLPELAPFLCTRRNSYTRKDFKSLRFSTYKHFLMMLKTKDFKPFRISRSAIFARNPFGFSRYIKTWGGGGGSIFRVTSMRGLIPPCRIPESASTPV